MTAPKKSVGEAFVRRLLEELYPDRTEDKDGYRVIYKDPEAVKLSELLDKFRGSRSQAAKELGISTTTLWRKMKKYGID